MGQLLWSDKRKFVWALSLLLAVAFIGTSWLGYQVAHRSLQQQIEQTTLPLTSDTIYSEIQQDLLQPIFISSLMAQDTFVRDWVLHEEHDSQAMIRYLTEIQSRFHTVTSFFVSEKTGRYYHPSGLLKTLSADEPKDSWYERVKQLPKGQQYEINIDFDTANPSQINVFVNYQVVDYQGNLIGVIGVGLALDAVKDLIEHYQQRYNRTIYFITDEGELALRSTDLRVPDNIHQREGLKLIATQLLTSPSGRYRFSEKGQEIYLNARFVPEFAWYLMVEQQNEPAEQELQHTLWINIGISLLVTVFILFVTNLTLGRYQRRLETMASTDKLTGCYNRQVFEQQLQISMQRRHTCHSIILLDIDHFKAINDQYGHLVGDQVLQRLVYLIQSQIRQSDLCCRWGGEEFAILLPECEGHAAFAIAEKIRTRVQQEKMTLSGHDMTFSVSCGIAQRNPKKRLITCWLEWMSACTKPKRAGEIAVFYQKTI